MVYFGERRFEKATRGRLPRERVRIIAPTVLLMLLVMILLSRQWSREDDVASVPVQPIAVPAPHAGADGGTALERGGWIPPPRDVTELEPNTAAEPFLADPAPLLSVRDDELPAPGERERDGLIWLFHRFRAGTPVPIVEPTVTWEELPSRKRDIRGERRRFTLTVREEPIPRSLPPNPSGVRRYWEAFCEDAEGHFVLLEFIEKPKILPADSEIEVVADFLRLHKYQMIRGGEGVVPEWVAAEAVILTTPPRAKGDWVPLLAVAGIAFLMLIPILWGILAGEGRSRRRVELGRRSRAGDAPSAPPSPR